MVDNPLRKILILVLLLFLVIGIAFRVAKGPPGGGIKERDFDYIGEAVVQLEGNPEAIIDFVGSGQEIREENYQGALRGPVGTLVGRAGSREDRAMLLVAMLRKAGANARYAFVEGGEVGVQLAEGDDWRTVMGPDAPIQSTAEELPAEMVHRLTVSLRRAGSSGVEQEAMEFSLAELAPRPLTLRFEQRMAVLELLGADRRIELPVDRDSDETLSLVFAHHSPGENAPAIITREIYTRRDARSAPQDDPRNRHVVMIAPWTMTQSVYEKEQELLASGERSLFDEDLESAWLLALRFLYESDQAMAELAERFSASCFFGRPRIVITSVFFEGDAPGRGSLAIDLRANTIRMNVARDDRVALGVARSTFESDLVERLLSESNDE